MIARCKKDFVVAITEWHMITFRRGVLYELNHLEDGTGGDLSIIPQMGGVDGGVITIVNNFAGYGTTYFHESPEFAEHFNLGDAPLADADVDPEILEQAQAARILLGEEE